MSVASETSADQRLARLRAQLSGQRSDTKSDRRMRLSRAGNLFIGASLRAAARKDQGLELTELEQRLLGILGTVLAEEEVIAFGRMYQEEASTRAATELFPEIIVGLPISEGFSREDLLKDLSALGAEIAAQPNASLVRLDELAEDSPVDTEEYEQALGTYGSGITVVLGPPDPAPRESRAATTVKLSFRDFWCVKRSGELGKDEIYWTSSAGSDTGSKKEYESGEFGAIVTGSHREFPAGSYLFNGTVNTWMTCNIACWEADHSSGGWYNDLRRGLRDISDYCFKTSEQLEQNSGEYEGSNAWFSLVGLVALLFDWLLGLITNEDDLVLERSLGFNRSALRALSQRPGGYDWWGFNGGGGGHHRINIRAEVTFNLNLRYNALSGTTWSGFTPFPSGSTAAAPALASFNNKLYCMVRGGNTNENLFYNSFNGTTWTSFTQLGGGASSPSSPALATHDGKLYSVHRAADGKLYWNSFNGTTWTSFTPFPSGSTAAAPALASFNNKLYCRGIVKTCG